MICQDELDWNETLIKRYVGREVGGLCMFIINYNQQLLVYHLSLFLVG
jgi:hypothetical protein